MGKLALKGSEESIFYLTSVHNSTRHICGKIYRVELYTELFYAIIPTLICYLYILLYF